MICNKMKVLTNTEEQIMQELWTLGKAFVNNIIGRLPDLKPASKYLKPG